MKNVDNVDLEIRLDILYSLILINAVHKSFLCCHQIRESNSMHKLSRLIWVNIFYKCIKLPIHRAQFTCISNWTVNVKIKRELVTILLIFIHLSNIIAATSNGS